MDRTRVKMPNSKSMSTVNEKGKMTRKDNVHKLLTRRNDTCDNMANIPQQVKKNKVVLGETQDSPKLVKLGDKLVTEDEMETPLLTLVRVKTKSEIVKIDKVIAAKEQQLAALKQALEDETKKNEKFLEITEKKIENARILSEKNREFKERTIAATEKLTNEIGTIKSEIVKNEEILTDYKRLKSILYRLLSSTREANARLDGDNSSNEEKLELHLSNPQKLLDQLIETKEKTLFLLERNTTASKPLEELQEAIDTTVKIMTEDEQNLTSRLNGKKCRLDEINRLSAQLQKNVRLHESLKEVDQDVLLKALDAKITKVRNCCRGAMYTSMSTPLQKLTAVEDHVTNLYEKIENIPENTFKTLKYIKDTERKRRMHEEKLRQEEEKRIEMQKKCLQRSLGETQKQRGRKLIPRCLPVEQKIQATVEENNPVEDETDAYQFTTEEMEGANMKWFFNEGGQDEQAAQKPGKQGEEGCMIARNCHRKLQLSHKQTSEANPKPTQLPPISSKDKLKSKDNLAYQRAAVEQHYPPGVEASNPRAKVTGESLLVSGPALPSIKHCLGRSKLQPLQKERAKANLKPTQLPSISNPFRLKPADNLASKKTTAGQHGNTVKGSSYLPKVTGDSLPTKQYLGQVQYKSQPTDKKNKKVDLKPTTHPATYLEDFVNSWPPKPDDTTPPHLQLLMQQIEEMRLAEEKESREKVLEDLQQRIVVLGNKLTEVRGLYLSHDMYLKDKDADQAVKKAERERKEGLKMEADRKRLEEHYNELLQRNQELQRQVQRHAVYQNFMEQLVRMTTWESVEAFICHSESLFQVCDQLYQANCKTQDHICELRKELTTLQDKHHLLHVRMNNQISQLQAELTEASFGHLKWQRRWTHIEDTAAKKVLCLGKIKIAILNLYEMISGKGEEEEGVAITDTDQQLEAIKQFIQDYSGIVKCYEMQLHKSNKSSEARKKH